jgi:methyl-accepting chemotaxis protein
MGFGGNLFKKAWNKASDTAKKATAAVATGSKKVGNHARKAANKAKKIASDAKNWIKKITKKIGEKVKKAGNWMAEKASQGVQKVKDIIKGAFQKAKELATDALIGGIIKLCPLEGILYNVPEEPNVNYDNPADHALGHEGKLYKNSVTTETKQLKDPDITETKQSEDVSENDYLHVFVLVPGTTQPVNNLFDFIDEDNTSYPSGKSYWKSDSRYFNFLYSVEKIKQEADKKNADDKNYHSENYFDFTWSGHNNFNERENAGNKLAKMLLNKYSAWGANLVYFHLIGHSHGGNVINSFTNSISGDDNWCQDWFVKSITYLSTPFFQKQEQPRSNKIHRSAVIYNRRNYYDLTQLCIADFTVEETSESNIGELAALVKKMKNSFKNIYKDLSSAYSNKKNVDSLESDYKNIKLKDKLTWDKYYNLKPELKKAKSDLEQANDELNASISNLKNDIKNLTDNIIEFVEKIKSLISSARNGQNKSVIDENVDILNKIIVDLNDVESSLQNLIEHAESSGVIKLIKSILSVISKLLQQVAWFAKDEEIYRIISMFSLHIIQFFDDTLQENSHYSGFNGFKNIIENVDGKDGFKNRRRYEEFRGILEPNEKKLHDHFLAKDTQEFRRMKWNDFDNTNSYLTPILKVIISQIAGPVLRSYKDDLENISMWIERVPSFLDKNIKDIKNSCDIIESFIDDLINNDLQLFNSGSSIDTNRPGTIPYLAIVSHSISREKISDTMRNKLVSNVTRA